MFSLSVRHHRLYCSWLTVRPLLNMIASRLRFGGSDIPFTVFVGMLLLVGLSGWTTELLGVHFMFGVRLRNVYL
jgi:hypothetical protein